MKVLVASKFLHHVGGVETYIAWLGRHLPDHGVEVGYFGMTPPDGDVLMPEVSGDVFLSPNRDYYGSPVTKVRSAATSIYSPAARASMSEAMDRFRPDLVHFQSTCYQLTPSVVAEVRRRGVPMVTTAHEYKFVCSNQRLWDDGRQGPCTKCLDASTTQRMAHVVGSRCVKGSLGSSVIAAAELPVANVIWSRQQGLVHAPSRFMAGLLEGRGSPVRGRIRYLDLSWGDPVAAGAAGERTDVVYTGRLSSEKGVEALIRAWPEVHGQCPTAALQIFGTGQDEERLRTLASGIPGVEFRGRYQREELSGMLARAAMTVHPSTWAENSPYTVRESLQHGVPAIVTDQGGLPEMVDGRTGTVVPVSDPKALACAIVDEMRARRAGTEALKSAVATRSVSDAQHLDGLTALYEEARSSVRASS